jgi:hypothetical protein
MLTVFGMTLLGWSGWEAMVALVVMMTIAYVVACWVGLAWWTWSDIRRRTTNEQQQLLSVALVAAFFVAGWMVYLLMRPQETIEDSRIEQLQYDLMARELTSRPECPRCKRQVSDDYLMCPYCRTELRIPCTQCSKPIALTWAACAYCGEPARRAAPAAAASMSRPARPQPLPASGRSAMARSG